MVTVKPRSNLVPLSLREKDEYSSFSGPSLERRTSLRSLERLPHSLQIRPSSRDSNEFAGELGHSSFSLGNSGYSSVRIPHNSFERLFMPCLCIA